MILHEESNFGKFLNFQKLVQLVLYLNDELSDESKTKDPYLEGARDALFAILGDTNKLSKEASLSIDEDLDSVNFVNLMKNSSLLSAPTNSKVIFSGDEFFDDYPYEDFDNEIGGDFFPSFRREDYDD